MKGSLDPISSPSSSVKIQIMSGKVCLRRKGKTLLGIVNKLRPRILASNSCYLDFLLAIMHQYFAFTPLPPKIWIFAEGEGDEIESKLCSYFLLFYFTWNKFCHTALTPNKNIIPHFKLGPTWNKIQKQNQKRWKKSKPGQKIITY